MLGMHKSFGEIMVIQRDEFNSDLAFTVCSTTSILKMLVYLKNSKSASCHQLSHICKRNKTNTLKLLSFFYIKGIVEIKTEKYVLSSRMRLFLDKMLED